LQQLSKGLLVHKLTGNLPATVILHHYKHPVVTLLFKLVDSVHWHAVPCSLYRPILVTQLTGTFKSTFAAEVLDNIGIAVHWRAETVTAIYWPRPCTAAHRLLTLTSPPSYRRSTTATSSQPRSISGKHGH